ncbi:MAG: DUF1552 domain-containing protein [Bacteroidia bacterium]|nr:DUF1552 domain-containing protein [Bacteroidia bacterium]
MKSSWNLSRRHMLKGMGASIALPFLEAMIPQRLFSLSKSPKRLAVLFAPNGVCPGKWAPEKEGKDFELSPILQPLKGFEDNLLVLQQLMNMKSVNSYDGHYTKTANFLTSEEISKTIGTNVHSGGVSMDQLIAQKVGGETLFPSLAYGIDRISSGVDVNVGLTRLYGSSISWKAPTQPCAKEIDPRFAFDRLFGRVVPGKVVKEENPWKKSILDVVQEDAKSLQKKLGIADQNKLEEYLESIRSIEMRLGNIEKLEEFEKSLSPDIKQELKQMDIRIDEYVDITAGIDITEKVRLMLDIIALAFWSDASRIATFMFGNSVSGRNFSFLEGVHANFHSLSHHSNDPRRMKQYELINTWHMEQLAYFLNKLRSMQEGDGNLLENSMVLFGSGLRDGNRHSPYNLPILLAGKGGGSLKSGQHLIFEKNTPFANLHLSLMNVMGCQMDSFADSTAELCEILV